MLPSGSPSSTSSRPRSSAMPAAASGATTPSACRSSNATACSTHASGTTCSGAWPRAPSPRGPVRTIHRGTTGVRHLLIEMIPVQDAAGALQGAICVTDDVTRQAELEDELLRRERLSAVGAVALALHDQVTSPSRRDPRRDACARRGRARRRRPVARPRALRRDPGGGRPHPPRDRTARRHDVGGPRRRRRGPRIAARVRHARVVSLGRRRTRAASCIF